MRCLIFGLVCLVVGCSSASGVTPEGPGAAGAAGAAGEGGAAGGAGSGGGVNIAGSDGGTTVEAEVFGHSQGELYKLNPDTKQVTKVGSFDCLSGNFGFGTEMWDIAVDREGAMVGTTSGSLVKIDKATAKCQLIKEGSYPNSLAFVPAGVLDPSSEALVGFNGASYVRIDPQSGQVQQIGSLNPNSTGQSWESSGDVVSIIGDKTYLTAHPLLDDGPDSILEVDPQTGKALKVIGATGFSDLWGLGYWGGVAYGFSSGGQLVQIDLSTGKGAAVPGLPSGLSFWGAGVTTAAPIGPIH